MNRKQFGALTTACDALQHCIDNDIDPDKSSAAMDIICEMIVKYRSRLPVKDTTRKTRSNKKAD